MHIEFIGCTSAGKSTLIRQILQASHRAGIDVIRGDDFVLRHLGLHRVDEYLPRGLLVNLIALVACLLSWRQHAGLARYATQWLLQVPIPWYERAQILRNVLKKAGIQELIRRWQAGQQVILIDEGVLQIAHNLFVHLSTEVDRPNLSAFVHHISMPDVVVYLRQPESLLIERTLHRGHRRIPNGTYRHVAHFIQQAMTTFEQLTQIPAVANRLLVIDGNAGMTVEAQGPSGSRMDLALEIIRIGITPGMDEPRQTMPARMALKQS